MISGLRGRPRGPQGSLSEAQEGPRWLQEGRGGPQEGLQEATICPLPTVPQTPPRSPKTAQERPKRAQDGPKRSGADGTSQDGPRGPEAGPGDPQDGLREAQKSLVRHHVPGRLSGNMTSGLRGRPRGP
eukprot:2075194-Pyramimonas_sp.AAC.1